MYTLFQIESGERARTRADRFRSGSGQEIYCSTPLPLRKRNGFRIESGSEAKQEATVKPIVMRARRRGRCGRCGDWIEPGQMIAWWKNGSSSTTRCRACHAMDEIDRRDRQLRGVPEPVVVTPDEEAQAWRQLKLDLARRQRAEA